RNAAQAFGTEKIQEIDIHHAILAGGLALRFHAHDDAGERARLRVVALLKGDFDALTAGLIDELAEAGILGQIEREALERLLHGVLAVVADGSDLAAAGVVKHEALEQVVDVLHGEGQVDALVTVDFALALEVADAAGKQHGLRDGQ